MGDFWGPEKPWLTVERLHRIMVWIAWLVLVALIFVIAVRV